MAAGQGYIEFATGDVLTAASANGYLASQVVMVFADAAARTAAITSPQEGMISYLKDTNVTQYYSGSAYVSIGGAASFSGVSVKATANQSIPNATFTAITWDSEYFDTDAFHSTSSNTSRFTIPSGKAGYYEIIGRLDYAANATGSRRIAIYKNGTLIQGSVFVVPAGGFEITAQINSVLNLAVADYIEIYGFQNSGGALDVYKTGGESEFTITFLGA